MDLYPHGKTDACRLLEQLRRIGAVLELLGEWGGGQRLGTLIGALPVAALRIFPALFGGFQTLQIAFQVVEETHASFTIR